MRLFISYRRSGADALLATLLQASLADLDWTTEVFLDTAGLAYGDRFTSHLRDQLSSADVVLAVVGPSWRSSLDNPGSWVLWELTQALRLRRRIIPILFEVASLEAVDLPQGLAPLAEMQSLSLRPDRVAADVRELVQQIEVLALRSRTADADGFWPARDPDGIVVVAVHADARDLSGPILVSAVDVLPLTGPAGDLDVLLDGALSSQLSDSDQTIVMASPQRDVGATIVLLRLDPGSNARQLSDLVERAVIQVGYGTAGDLSVTSTLLGCEGPSALSIARSIHATLGGVRRGSMQLRRRGRPGVARLRFVDAYDDRIELVRHELEERRTDWVPFQGYVVAAGVLAPAPSSGPMPVQETWNVLTVGVDRSTERERWTIRTPEPHDEVSVSRAPAWTDDLVDLTEPAGMTTGSVRPGAVLHEVLVPPGESRLFSGAGLLLKLSEATAAFPWESIELPGASKPVGLDVPVIRDFADVDRRRVAAYIEPRALINVPSNESDGASRLVRAVLDAGYDVRIESPGASPTEAIGALFADSYRLVHLSGRAEVTGGDEEGLGLGDGSVVTPRTLTQMTRPPQVVTMFLARDGVEPRVRRQRSAALARVLVDCGVDVVVTSAADLTEGHEAAFSATFYSMLLGGQPLHEAVLAARRQCAADTAGQRAATAIVVYGNPALSMTPG